MTDTGRVGRVLFCNVNLLDPEQTGPVPLGWLLVEDGRIADWEQGLPPPELRSIAIDGEGLWLAPGFIDLHVHGPLAGAHAEEVPASLLQLASSLAQRGTTAFLATTVSAAAAPLDDFVSRIAATPVRGARCLGVHLEGPWIHPDRAGAHERSAVRPYDRREARELVARAEGTLAMVTLAPEVPGGLQAVEDLRQAGLVVALGHSEAQPLELDGAIARGLTHVTHLFNAMGALHHRNVGTVGMALTDDRLTTDVICDGVHVDPRMIRLAATAKRERLCLISDQVGPQLGPLALVRDGCVWRKADGGLAGSAVSLDQSVACFRRYTGVDLREAVAAATVRPARVLGVEREHGTLRRGARADLVLLDREARVRATWLAGAEVPPAW